MGMGIQTIRVGDPTQAAGGDAGELEGDAVAIAQFLGAIFEKANQGPVDVAEAEEAEVVGLNGDLLELRAVLRVWRTRRPRDSRR